MKVNSHIVLRTREDSGLCFKKIPLKVKLYFSTKKFTAQEEVLYMCD